MARYAHVSFLAIAMVSLLSLAPAFAAEPIRFQIPAEPYSLDPTQATDQHGYGIIKNVYEGLFRMDEKGKLEPAVAKSHTVSKDGLVYRFKLRPDSRWSDGKPVTIDDFVTGFRRAIDPKVAAANADLIFSIKGARDVYAGKAPADALAVRAEKDELVIELERPDAAFLQVLSMPFVMPVRKDRLGSDLKKWDVMNPANGPYKIAHMKTEKEIRLEPNEHHPAPGKHPVLVRILNEEATALSLFETGHLDIVSSVTYTEIDRLKAKGLVGFHPSTTVFYLSFNTKKGAASDSDMRKAIAASIDREGIAKLLSGAFEPTTSYLPKSIEGYRAFDKIDRSKSVAKIRALAEKPRLRLGYAPSAFNDIIMQKVQSDLQKGLGIEVSLEPMEWKAYLNRLKTDPPEIFYGGMGAPYDDPMYHLNVFSSAQTPAYSRYANPEYEKLLEEIKAAPLGKKRTELAQKAQTLIIERDAVVVPLLLRYQVYGVSKSVKGFAVNPHNIVPFNRITR